MSQPIERQLSEEDYQLLEANHLGHPLSIYRLRVDYIRIIRGLGLLLLVIGCVPPMIMITIVFLGLHKEQPDSVFYLFILIVLSSFIFLMGLFILCVEVPRIRNQHLIICEQGLVEVRKRGWSKQVKMIFWQDIVAIRKVINEYSISYQVNNILILDTMYQSINTLIEMIRQRSGIV